MLVAKFRFDTWGTEGNELLIDWSPNNTLEFGPFTLNWRGEVTSLTKKLVKEDVEYEFISFIWSEAEEVPDWA